MEEKEMVGSLLSAANWPIVGQICWVLGKVMNFIYTMLDGALPSDTGLVGISIILYTILVYTLMLPMTMPICVPISAILRMTAAARCT